MTAIPEAVRVRRGGMLPPRATTPVQSMGWELKGVAAVLQLRFSRIWPLVATGFIGCTGFILQIDWLSHCCNAPFSLFRT